MRELYVLAKGTVEFSATEKSGKALRLCQKTAPEMFGEVSLGREKKEADFIRHTTVTAITDCTFLVMEQKVFLDAQKNEAMQEWNHYLEYLGNHRIRDYILCVPFFRNMPPDRVPLLEDILEYSFWKKDSVIIEEGTAGNEFYIVSRGAVKVTQEMQGREAVLAELGEGSYFGEIALLEDISRQATVTSSKDCLLLMLHKAQFANFLKFCPHVKHNLEKSIQLRTAQNFRDYEVPFLSGLNDKQLGAILELCKTVEYEKGEDIIKQGSVAQTFYILEVGRVHVSRKNDKAETEDLGKMQKGTYFGELALITDSERLATVTAMEKCICLEFHKDAFQHLFAHSAEARADFELKVLGEKTELIHVLRHALGLKLFAKHMEEEYSPEMINFWGDVARFDLLEDPKMLKEKAHEMFNTYISQGATAQVCVLFSIIIIFFESIYRSIFFSRSIVAVLQCFLVYFFDCFPR